MTLSQRKIKSPLLLLFTISLFLTIFPIISQSVYAAALSSVSHIPWSSQVSIEGKQTTKFTTVTSLPANGKIVITYPNGFDVSQTTFDSWSGFDGGRSVSVNGQTITITRDNTGTSSSAGAKYVVLNNITNSSTAGSSYTVTVETQNSGSTALDGPTISSTFSCVSAISGTNHSPWNQHGKNPQHTAANSFSGNTYRTVKWTTAVPSSYGPVVIGEDGMIYVGGGYGARISAISADGSLQWTTTINSGSASHTFFIGVDSENTVYAVDNSTATTHLYALNPDGTTKWSTTYNLTSGGYGLSIFENDGEDLLAVNLNADGIRLYRRNDGVLKWQGLCSDYSYYCGRSLAVSSDNNLYGTIISGSNYGLRKMNLAGQILWTKTFTQNIDGNVPIIATDGTIYLGNQSGLLYAINPSDGSTKWTWQTNSNAALKASPGLAPNGNIYFGDNNGIVYAVKDSGSSAVTQWTYNTTGSFYTGPDNWNYKIINSDANSNAYFNSPSQQKLIALDSNGTFKWNYQKQFVARPGGYPIDNQGIMYITTASNSVMAFSPWTLSGSVNPSGYYKIGDTMTITALTSMLKRDPEASEDNQVQAVMPNGDKVVLSYVSASGGNTTWQGLWAVPVGTADGSYTTTVEAAAYKVETDTTTHFATAPTGSSNMGITNTFTYTVDNTAPTGSVSINSGSTYTIIPEVTLTLSATDATSSVSQMMISNNSDFTGVSWETYATTKSLTLSSGDGTKTAYVKFQDQAGNISEVYSDTIIYDSNPPSDEISINSGAIYTKVREVILTINATDILSGVSQMMVSEDSTLTGASWETYAATKTWILSSGDGTKTIYIKFKDRAGNISSIFHDSIILDTTQPTLILLKLNGKDFTADITTWEVTSNKPPFSGTTDPGATVTITISGTPPITGTVTAGADGTWSWTPATDIPTGEYTVTIVSTDLAGNTTSNAFTLKVLGVNPMSLPNTGTPYLILLATILAFLFSGAGTKLLSRLQKTYAKMRTRV